MSSTLRRTLPPGVQQQVIFGIMWIRIGALKTIRPTSNASAHTVHVQFWGQPDPAVLQTSSINPSTQQYEVKCPVTFFEKYLSDMKNNLKIQVVNLGRVGIDLSSFLRSKVTLTTKSPFEHFKGLFDVIGKNQKKVASLEIQMSANFNPNIALRQLQEQMQNEEVESPQAQPQIKKVQTKQQNVIKKQQPALTQQKKVQNDVPIIQKQAKKQEQNIPLCPIAVLELNAQKNQAVRPQLFQEFYGKSVGRAENLNKQQDRRIANSLATEPNREQFNPGKYADNPATPTNKQFFPTVQKILTYSNLKLHKDQQKQKASPSPSPIKSPLVNPISNQPTPAGKQIQSIAKQPPATPINNLNPLIRNTESTPKPIQAILQPTLKRAQVGALKPIQTDLIAMQKRKSDDLMPVLQQLKGAVDIDQVSQVRRVQESVSLQDPRQILSRVVNLQQQIEKQRLKSPKKAPLKQATPPNYQPSLKQTPPSLPQYYPSSAQKGGHKKSSPLLLTMIVELNTSSVKFETARPKFQISYRPYGHRESVKTGPLLPPQLQMVFPVGQAQILKMNTVPFIIQLWSVSTHQFLGMVSLSLAKIQKGFILQGRLNELAIKTSLAPTVIHKDIHNITSLIGKTLGQCYLSAVIGTANQIQVYLNTPKKNEKVPIQEPTLIPKKEDQLIVKKDEAELLKTQGWIQDLTSLLQLIDSLSRMEDLQKLIQFMKKGTVNQQEFANFLTNIGYKGKNVFKILSDGTTLQSQQLNLCFDKYKLLKEALNVKLKRALKSLSPQQHARILKQLPSITNFGTLTPQDLAKVLPQPLLSLQSLFPSIIDADLFQEWLKTHGSRPLTRLSLTTENIQQQLIDMLFQGTNPQQAVERLLAKHQGVNEISIFTVRETLRGQKQRPLSVWVWLMLRQIINNFFEQKQGNSLNINTALLYNWVAIQTRQRAKEALIKNEGKKFINDQPQQQRVQKQEIQQISMKRSQQRHYQQQIIQKQKQNQEFQQRKQKKQENQNENVNNLQEKQQINQQGNRNAQQGQISPEKPIETILEHKLVISLEELHLQQATTGECHLYYRFPYEQEQVTSKKVQLLTDKHKYKLQCAGTHKVSIPQPFQQYLGESCLAIRVNLGHQQLYGDLHSQEMATIGSHLKVVPLFSSHRQGIAGKVKLRINYQVSKSLNEFLGRQTTKDVFLPKSGFLNFQVSTQVDHNKIRQQYSLKEDFYLQLIVDLFGQNSNLAPHYPPLHSKLQSQTSLSLSGSLKISLSPVILGHLRNGSCTVRLNLVYYGKQGGNYQRKELIVAYFRVPLLSVIKEEGIRGDYSLKNKLGMHIALAQCSIKYQKQASNQSLQGYTGTQNSRESYWLVVDFAEIINFQGDLGWLKFQIINRGKRISTQKSQIIQQGVIQLNNRCIMLQMGQEQFSATKILPVSIVSASQHFAIDINLRPIAKALLKHPYFLHGHHFLAIDNSSRPRKLRVGARVYCFRGPPSLTHFVQAVARNPLRGAQISCSDDNYPQAIDWMRKQLKLSSKVMQEALSLLVNRRRKQRLSPLFFNNKIAAHLQVTPIIAQDESQVGLIVEQLPSQVDIQLLMQYVQQANIRLLNFREQLLQRYSFSKLNQNRIDQNVQYLGLHSQVDLLVLASKIKVEQTRKEQSLLVQNTGSKMIRISIIRGYNFCLLYNGIPPNSRVRIPQIGLQTDMAERTNQPIFNEHLSLQVKQNINKKLAVQVYHETKDEQTQPILIGQGTLSLTQSLRNNQLPNSKVYKVVIGSLMSQRAQATIDVKIEVSLWVSEPVQQANASQFESSMGDSRIEQIMNKVKEGKKYARRSQLFESSDED